MLLFVGLLQVGPICVLMHVCGSFFIHVCVHIV